MSRPSALMYVPLEHSQIKSKVANSLPLQPSVTSPSPITLSSLMRILRGFSSMLRPRSIRSLARTPLIFTAQYFGGICSISPVNCGKTLSSASLKETRSLFGEGCKLQSEHSSAKGRGHASVQFSAVATVKARSSCSTTSPSHSKVSVS